ncbi:craniofacial development protein 2-like [Palaemon carinicauda]|uniref:craniofacial development protein 2-like n=1 Tax=Palaemon carinicauda TaxID=392227 RepID=UPI0035B5A56A
MGILVCYAPKNYSPEERTDEYYEEQQRVIDDSPERYKKVVIGEFNAKVGRNNHGIENVIGVESLGEVVSENGAHLISFCSANTLVTGGTLFQRMNIQKSTWTSPFGIYKNQRDHIAINKERSMT